jgi:subtilase family serine protease
MVSSVSAAFSVAAGSALAVSETVLNQGVDGAGASTTRFYLSVNSVFDAGDVLLPGSRAVPALAAGASSSGSTSVTIPAGTATGTYFLIVRTDADNVVAEGQESNNNGLRFIQVTAP